MISGLDLRLCMLAVSIMTSSKQNLAFLSGYVLQKLEKSISTKIKLFTVANVEAVVVSQISCFSTKMMDSTHTQVIILVAMKLRREV